MYIHMCINTHLLTLFRASILDPLVSRRATTSLRPLYAAMVRGVSPSYPRQREGSEIVINADPNTALHHILHKESHKHIHSYKHTDITTFMWLCVCMLSMYVYSILIHTQYP